MASACSRDILRRSRSGAPKPGARPNGTMESAALWSLAKTRALESLVRRIVHCIRPTRERACSLPASSRGHRLDDEAHRPGRKNHYRLRRLLELGQCGEGKDCNGGRGNVHDGAPREYEG